MLFVCVCVCVGNPGTAIKRSWSRCELGLAKLD